MTVVRRKEEMIPSPQARDSHGGTARPHGWAKSEAGEQRNINDFVLRFPTSKARDAIKCSPGQKPRDDLKCAVEIGTTKSATYPTPRVNSLCGGTGAWNAIQNNPNLTVEEKRGMTSTHGLLNPDWVEWLMFWPVGWTNLDTPNHRLVWLDPSIDPADFDDGARIPIITTRRENRPARIKECGNGQFPLSAVAAFFWGLCVLEVVV